MGSTLRKHILLFSEVWRVKFTDASLRALKSKTERYEAWENNGKGFGLRVSPAGKNLHLYVPF